MGERRDAVGTIGRATLAAVEVRWTLDLTGPLRVVLPSRFVACVARGDPRGCCELGSERVIGRVAGSQRARPILSFCA